MKSNINLLLKTIVIVLSFQLQAQDVNPFTGSLNYGAGVFAVPSDRGDAVPINLGYGTSGINVMQPASDVGLGWNLSAGGSIYRTVNGMPDDIQAQRLNTNRGIYYLQKGVLWGPTEYDVLSSKRNSDTAEFYYPNYDSYNISGPGIGGSMTPLFLNYLAFKKTENGGYEYDVDMSAPWKQPQFIFNGDFSDTLTSRHYPNTLNSSTPYKLPKDVITGDCLNNANSYFGKRGNGTGSICSENYEPTSNRLATANFVEYTIDNVNNRISGFKITNSAGFVYRYDLPVYVNSTINFSYPLANNYSLPKYTSTFNPDVKTVSGTNYFVTHQMAPASNTVITEWKEDFKYAKEWKLTSITGPDYEDVNANGLIDASDNGYWVKFEYKLWASNLSKRYPSYGFNYSFGLDDKTKNYALKDPAKISGKTALAFITNEEVYYLTSVQTSSHKAIIVRDVRQDEFGTNPSMDSGIQDSIQINHTQTVASWHGNMFDDQGAASYNSAAGTTFVKTVQLGSIDKLILNFKTFGLINNIALYDKLHIYAGPNDTYPEISFTHSSVTYNSPFTSAATIPGTNIDITLNNFTASAITFKFEKLCSTGSAAGFNVEWHASGKKIPQLYVKRMLLLDNSYTLPTVTPATSTITDFDFTSTQNTSAPIYNETWYQANATTINPNVLKGVVLEYDYSLANKYHGNISGTFNIKASRMVNQAYVNANTAFASNPLGTGKLTLTKIIKTELQNVQMEPSVKLDYNATNALDNPDYNPLKVDNWGYYKSDASALGYYGYATTTSKDYTDAWSLRKITSPMGGITEIEYESNTYSKVFTGKGGIRGPVRIYPIDSISTVNPSTNPLKLYLEEGTNLPSDLSDVYNAAPPVGLTTEVFIPTTNDNTPTYTHAGININYYGTYQYNYNAGTPLPIVTTNIQKLSSDNGGIGFYNSVNVGAMPYNDIADIGLVYTGNGYVKFSLPTTYQVYGAGARVKKITARNGTTDAYVTLYEYEDGVALNEADRFTNPITKTQRYINSSLPVFSLPEKLNSFGGDQFDLAATIGYSKVKIKNLGQVNAAKGWKEVYFNTSDAITANTFIDNYKVNLGIMNVISNTGNNSNQSGTCTRQDSIYGMEYIDKYSPYWGLTKEQRVYDVNNNMLNKDVYEYETTEQGAMVENFAFAVRGGISLPCNGEFFDPCCIFNSSIATYQVCIKRQYPAVLKKTTSYGLGTTTISETLKRDEITGEALVTRVIGENKSTAVTIKTPAYRIGAFANMGPKSVNPAWSNVLGAEAYFYTVVDSNLTSTAPQNSPNFAGASAAVYSKTMLKRSFNAGSNTFVNTSVTLPNWINKASFTWAGDVGSLDSYGLYKKTELTANPFNFNTPYSNSNKWRFAGEISLVDKMGHTLENRAFNNKFTATKFDVNGKFIISSITNCNYASFTFSGFEQTGPGATSEGEVNIPAATSTIFNPDSISIKPHTGTQIVEVNAGDREMGPNYAIAYNGAGTYGEDIGLMRDRVYRASVWVHNSSSTNARLVINLDGSIGGTPSNQSVIMTMTDAMAITIGQWKLLTVEIKVPANYTSTGGTTNKLTAYVDVQTSGTAYFDDFQLHPVESNVASKVYDPLTGRVTADIDGSGFAKKYEYDAAGRVINTYAEIPNVGLKLIKHTTYNYGRGMN